MNQEPHAAIAAGPMHSRQVLTVVLIIACVAIDGFDVFSIAFAAPLIAASWHLAPATLGIVLSMELIGMGIGAYFVGLLADRIGRRVTIIGSLAITASGMWLASLCVDVTTLAITRLFTGLGIGGILVAGSTLISETANDRRRDMCVALMVAGYPLGVAVGGLISARLLAATGRWQAIFEIGSAITAVLIIPVALLLCESVSFLSRSRSPTALQKMNRVLALYGKDLAIATHEPKSATGSVERLQPAGISALSVALMTAFFLHMMTFYFLMKWIPKLVVDLGYTASTASIVVMWANVAGTAGSLLMSALALRYPLRVLVTAGMASGGVAVALFGQPHENVLTLSVAAGAAGFFTTGATAGFYALLTRSFSSRVRAGNTGFIIGFGRSGAAAGPVAAGFLFALGWPVALVATILGAAGVLASVVVNQTASLDGSVSRPTN